MRNHTSDVSLINLKSTERAKLSEKLILWDIDGTLLRAKRKRETPLHLEVARNLGLKISVIPFESEGLTDSDIMEQLLSLNGKNLNPRTLKAALDELDELSSQSDEDTTFEIFPGVVEALEYMKSNSWDMGVLTGNTFKRAISKMEKSKLERFFDHRFFFTCNPGESRVKIAIRAHSILENFGIRQATIIGDTPADIYVARRVGYQTISVATGRFSLNNLAVHKPDLIIENLDSSLTRVAEFIKSQSN